MFTGIVQGTAQVVEVTPRIGSTRLVLNLESLAQGVNLGASISVAGVCLTAVKIDDTHVTFDVIGETLRRTTLGSVRVGERLNIERSVKVGDEIGGHLMSGHVSGSVTIADVNTASGDYIVKFRVDESWRPYILPKGFIGLDGCSLTIVEVGSDWFTVHLIPETLARTTFGSKRAGERVNMEIDAMTQAVVETVRRVLRSPGACA